MMGNSQAPRNRGASNEWGFTFFVYMRFSITFTSIDAKSPSIANKRFMKKTLWGIACWILSITACQSNKPNNTFCINNDTLTISLKECGSITDFLKHANDSIEHIIISGALVKNNMSELRKHFSAPYGAFQSLDISGCNITENNCIEEGAFESCHLLTDISLPEGIKRIGAYAFFDCNSLKSIHIPKKVSVIQKCTFMGCESLETIELPSSITHINEHAFMGCKMLHDIVIPDNVVSIGYASFDGCTSLTNITLPETLNHISKFAFYQSPLETIYCKASFPPTIYPSTFSANNATLYILQTYEDLYQQSLWGRVFQKIIITTEDIP